MTFIFLNPAFWMSLPMHTVKQYFNLIFKKQNIFFVYDISIVIDIRFCCRADKGFAH